MANKTVRIGLVLLVLAVASGFFLCPRMNGWMGIKSATVVPHEQVVNESRSEQQALVGNKVTYPADPDSVDVISQSEVRTLRALKVVPAEELKEQNYRAYVFRRYADAKGTLHSIPAKAQSEQYVRDELGPKLVSYLEANKANDAAGATSP